MKKIPKLLMAFSALLLLAGCTQPVTNNPANNSPSNFNLSQQAESQQASITIQSQQQTQTQMQPQQKMGEQTQQATLKIGSQQTQVVEPKPILKKLSPFKLVSEGDNYRQYSGTEKVSGTYNYFAEDFAFMSSLVCFYPDKETSYVVPRIGNDQRMAWFCFSNQETAKKLLGLSSPPKSSEQFSCFEGKATIKISSYFVNLMESEVWDEAKIVSVITKTKPVLTVEGCAYGD